MITLNLALTLPVWLGWPYQENYVPPGIPLGATETCKAPSHDILWELVINDTYNLSVSNQNILYQVTAPFYQQLDDLEKNQERIIRSINNLKDRFLHSDMKSKLSLYRKALPVFPPPAKVRQHYIQELYLASLTFKVFDKQQHWQGQSGFHSQSIKFEQHVSRFDHGTSHRLKPHKKSVFSNFLRRVSDRRAHRPELPLEIMKWGCAKLKHIAP